MLSNLRNTLFWISDWLKGAEVRKHYIVIEKIHKDHTSEFTQNEKKKYLDEILTHAVKTVPYYRELGISDLQLDKFPVVNKNLIKQNLKLFHSDSFLDQNVFTATTSGSTGTPFTVLHNSDKKKRHQADVRFYWKAIGHPFGTRFYYLKIWNEKNRKDKWVQKKQNIVPVDVFKMDDEAMKKLLEDIKSDSNPKSILGYSSALDSITKYLKRYPSDMTRANVISIVAMSETLDGPTQKALGLAFDCPVVSRYANIENGMLAQQTKELPKEFLVNHASYNIEILSLENDVPTEDGTLGRIVVTDLFNKAMPLIRYDTGDLGILGKNKRGNTTHLVLKKVEGRKMDAIYNTLGETISSFTITNSMWKYTELAQYQFIQNSQNHYHFKLNCQEKFGREEELISEFKKYLGEDAAITIEYVDEIPLLSSGKRKKVLNLM